jgi:hypothetical protein
MNPPRNEKGRDCPCPGASRLDIGKLKMESRRYDVGRVTRKGTMWASEFFGGGRRRGEGKEIAEAFVTVFCGLSLGVNV